MLAALLRHLGVPVPDRPEGYSIEDTRHAHAELLSAAREGAPDRILAALEQVLHLVPLCYTPLPPFTLATRNPLTEQALHLVLPPPVICFTPLSYASPPCHMLHPHHPHHPHPSPLIEQAPHLVRMADADGSTPLMVACDAGHDAAASLLSAAGGAGSEAGGSQGGAGAEHALVAAAAAGQLGVAEWLLVRGAAKDESRGAGPETPLHAAAAQGHSALISLLLAHGASPAPLNQRGQTALQLAQLHGQASCAQLLADAARPSGRLHAAAADEVPRAAHALDAWASGGAAGGGGGASGAMQQ
mgnify:CR=1 FL=1